MPLKIDAHDWPDLSALFDQALDLHGRQREDFVARLTGAQAAHREALVRLLADHAAVETQDFMQALPTPGVAEDDAAHADEPPLPGGDSLVGPYCLLRELGRGGMGSVWLAERPDGIVKRQVALKLPHAGWVSRGFSQRLIRERDILASLDHPHIARLYDAGVTAQGQPYLALAYVQGQSLIDHCNAQQLPVHERIMLFQQVLDAVQYAHAHLVIHRDLKPSNVLVDEQGQVHLLDFGIAKLLIDGQAEATALTLDAGQAMTPDYASPEQLAGDTVSIASDIYSLGVLLYELLTGVRPYELKELSHLPLHQAVLDVEVQRPSQAVRAQPGLARRLRGDLDTIVLKALKKRPADRYATAQALRDDLQRHLDRRPVLARPDSLAYRMRRLVGRNRLLLGTTTAVVLVLVAATSVSLRQASLAREQARTARAALGFLEDIFSANSANRPDPQKARNTTARELLDIGAQRMDTSLADAPQARLRVATTLARMYDDLDLRAEVVALHRKRVALSQSLYGHDDSRVAEALVDLAAAASDNNQHELGDQSRSEAARILDQQRDFSSVARAKLELERAEHLNNSGGKLNEALAHATRAVEIFRGAAPSEEQVSALNVLTHIQLKLGHLDEARAAVRQALQSAASAEGGMKNRLAYLHQSAADVEAARGDMAQAQRELDLALAAADKSSGPGSPVALSILSDQGYFLVGAAQYGAAVARLDRAAQRARAMAASTDASDIEPIVFRRYAAALVLFGRPEQALQALQTAQGLWHGKAGVDEDALLLGETARTQMELGHFDLAEAALAQRTQLLRERASGRVGRDNETRMFQVQLLLARGVPAQAQRVFAELEPDARAKPGTRLAWARSAAAVQIHLALGQWDEAGQLAGAMLSGLTATPQRVQFTNYEAYANWAVGEALRRSGRAAAAEPVLRRAVQLHTQVYDPEQSPLLARAQIALAECELALGHAADARALLSAATAIHAHHADLGAQYREPLRDLQRHLQSAAGAAAAAPPKL